ncbi:metallophosphoesterase [Allocoprobacillus halotolerans]|uniref:Metallophosphoesterase n=1 Tax=Allocoprobacillus halotolerans TaxID=2944914 RepID=A0ABY5I1W8_9FIRM|nr:metallophosphoesterase [Allocoprobacillus halotolerans]UTY38384.1 metallophosphoesterase [Allocoprobacillus halotolerans]
MVVFSKNIPSLIKTAQRLGVIPILCLLILLGYGYMHMKDVNPIYYTVTTQKQLSQDYKVAFISDLHFPNTMNEKELQSYCQDISRENLDIVLLGGDIVDERTSLKDMQHTFEILSTIENQYGIYYVYGNHDQALYASQPAFTPEQLQQTIEKNHIHVLCDEKTFINDDIVLIGRDDRSHPRDSLQNIMQGTSSTDFLLVMDHQPVDLEKIINYR